MLYHITRTVITLQAAHHRPSTAVQISRCVAVPSTLGYIV